MERDADERLSRLLGGPELAWVLARVRRRLELGQPLHGTIVLRSASAAEHDAVARLLGRRPRRAGSLRVPLDELDAMLRRSGAHAGGLSEAVLALTGPVTVRADAAARSADAWSAAFTGLRDTVAGRSALERWTQRIEHDGFVKRLTGGSPDAGGELLDTLAIVVAALPARGGESLGAFAAQTTGRAHALDDGTALGTLALGAARALAGLGPPAPGESTTEARREAWASAGVLCDELSSTVLTVGLAGDEMTPTGRMLGTAREAGEPVWLTLRQLVRAPPEWPVTASASAAPGVLVVENPSVLAFAAGAYGPHCPPLICTSGQPRAAAMVLLRALAAAGVRLHHHGDFDWPGIAIGNVLHRRLALEPLLFDAGAYLRAAAANPRAAPLTGAPVAACWDERLEPAMLEAGVRIEEELVAEELAAAMLTA